MQEGSAFDSHIEERRAVFSVAVVASFLAIITFGKTDWVLLELLVGGSAMLSSIYLIMSAAQLKYRDSKNIYETIPVNERFRKWMYDWSIDIFGAGLLLIIGSLTLSMFSEEARLAMIHRSNELSILLMLLVGAGVVLVVRGLALIFKDMQLKVSSPKPKLDVSSELARISDELSEVSSVKLEKDITVALADGLEKRISEIIKKLKVTSLHFWISLFLLFFLSFFSPY